MFETEMHAYIYEADFSVVLPAILPLFPWYQLEYLEYLRNTSRTKNFFF